MTQSCVKSVACAAVGAASSVRGVYIAISHASAKVPMPVGVCYAKRAALTDAEIAAEREQRVSRAKALPPRRGIRL